MRKLLERIDYSNPDNKYRMNDLFIELLDSSKEDSKSMYEYAKCEIYEMVYGKKVTDEMADKWVKHLIPMAKWTKEDVSNVAMSYGVDIPLNCAYVLMNMLYSDSKNVYGSGDDDESIKKYIDGVKDFYYDEDSKYKEEEKVYEYGKHIFGVWDKRD